MNYSSTNLSYVRIFDLSLVKGINFSIRSVASNFLTQHIYHLHPIFVAHTYVTRSNPLQSADWKLKASVLPKYLRKIERGRYIILGTYIRSSSRTLCVSAKRSKSESLYGMGQLQMWHFRTIKGPPARSGTPRLPSQNRLIYYT